MTIENNISTTIIEAIQDRKGSKIVVVDLSDIEAAATSQYIIAQGSSTTQVAAIADRICELLLDKCKRKPYNIDGMNNAEWVVIDYGDVWVHVFLPETRLRYNLEDLWSDAHISSIPDLD